MLVCNNKKKFLSFFFLAFIYFLNAEEYQEPSIVFSNSNVAYANSLQVASPNLSIQYCKYSSALRVFDYGTNIAVDENFALPLLQGNPDYLFSGHYIQTVVIVVDREQTNERIESWDDLLKSQHAINFSFGKNVAQMVWNTPQNYHIVTSMAHALYGWYDIKSIAQDFKILHETRRFYTNDNSMALSVMYDSDAIRLLEEGRNIEIVLPSEGTHAFIGGILYTDTIQIDTVLLEKELIGNGLRLIDGRSNSYYPKNEMYRNVTISKDHHAFNKAIASIDSIMRRESFNTKRYGFANTKERTIGYIICIIAVIMYLVSAVLRINQKNIRNAIVLICSLELLLATTQYIKSLVSYSPVLETFLWYAFYFSFVLIPTIFVYIAIKTGLQSASKTVPISYKIYFSISCLIILFVASNTRHELVFIIHNYYHSYFSYNWGYYLVMGWIYLSIAFALITLIYKAFQSPRKWAFLLPILSAILTLLYTIGIVLKVPIARDFEVGYGTAIALLLFIESCIQSRIFPVNKGYNILFAKSSLRIEIRDKANNLVISSSNPGLLNTNYTLKKTPIAGGAFWYYEDYSEINRTKRRLSLSNEALKKNNLLLQQKNEVEAELGALSVQKEVYKTIDYILQRDTKKIAHLLDSVDETTTTNSIIPKINIIACGIKRECIMRINALYKETQHIKDFLNYIHEIREFTTQIPMQITIGSEIREELPMQYCLLVYEFFRIILEQAANLECDHILVQAYKNKDDVVFSIVTNKNLLPHIDILPLNIKAESIQASFTTKPWEDTTVFLITLKKGISAQ